MCQLMLHNESIVSFNRAYRSAKYEVFFFFFFGLKKDFIAQKTQPEIEEKQKDQAWTHL